MPMYNGYNYKEHCYVGGWDEEDPNIVWDGMEKMEGGAF